jgi:hypothetical protein
MSHRARISYLDPYVSGRSPEFDFWNFGVQREILPNLTLMVNYAGSQSHFLAGASNIRGLQSGELDPKYFVLGQSILTSPATQANIAKAAAIIPGIQAPYAGYVTAAGTTAGAGHATIAQMLTWMPQYSGVTDTWGSQTANASYHSVQVSLSKRLSNGLTFNVNYTYEKQLDDTGTIRTWIRNSRKRHAQRQLLESGSHRSLSECHRPPAKPFHLWGLQSPSRQRSLWWRTLGDSCVAEWLECLRDLHLYLGRTSGSYIDSMHHVVRAGTGAVHA